MPLIETRHITKTRKNQYCEDCGKTLPIGSKAVAMFGMAHDGEKPWWMYTHERGNCPNPSIYSIEQHRKSTAQGPADGEKVKE